MVPDYSHFADRFDARFKIFHELMQRKIRNILLVSTLYDACLMEEDGRLAERITHGYKGLSLSEPPRLTWASSAEQALNFLEKHDFDLVITMRRLADMDAYAFGKKLKAIKPHLPIILLTHSAPDPICARYQDLMMGIDRTLVWTGNADLLLALIKSVEDQMNVDHDTEVAGVRIILFVEDSYIYISKLLPVLYKEVMLQTQAVMEQGLNEEHKLLTMRARPKILLAQNFEEATRLFERYLPFILGVISDVCYPRECQLDDEAGIKFLSRIKREKPDIPLLLASSEAQNAEKAAQIPAIFLNKNSPSLHAEVQSFLTGYLGFGEFVFRLPDGREIAKVSNMHSFEKLLRSIPLESFYYHWSHNDFSRWLFARSEIILASKLRPATDADFSGDVESMRQFIVSNIHERRRRRQKGVVASFDANDFDPDTEFLKIGKGSLGGKARGMVFISNILHRQPQFQEKYPDVDISFPRTLVITTDAFDSFMQLNGFQDLHEKGLADSDVSNLFLEAQFPNWLEDKLKVYLSQVKHPIAIRSSSLLEDSQFQPYAGLYRTYMLPNNQADPEIRLEQLRQAIKLVYASTYFQGPRNFARRTPHRTEEEKMAIIIQRLVGRQYGNYFYPAISGVAQSHNYYPVAPMRPEEGIAHVAMGLGKIVMEGGAALRFSPKHPQVLPQFSTVADMLKNAQRRFYALKMTNARFGVGTEEDSTLTLREVADAQAEEPVRLLASTFVPEEDRIRDDPYLPGPKLITFAQILKYRLFPLAEILSDVLQAGRAGMGCPVEIEFSVDLCQDERCKPEFALLQIRPMASHEELREVKITDEELSNAICFSAHALGNGVRRDMADIIYVKPDAFDPVNMPRMAKEIGVLNGGLSREGRKYLLIGPGRWGSADRWLGIPVDWSDIFGVGAIIETTAPGLNAEPSQGSHFFHNITTLGIDYIMVRESTGDFLNWQWLQSLPVARETAHVAQVQLSEALYLKTDGKNSRSVILGRVLNDA